MGAGMAPSMEVKAYQEAMQEILKPQWGDRPSIDTECRMDFFFSRTLVTYVSDKGRNVTKHRQDLTNLRKSSEDCLQPWLITNDVLITSGWTEIIEQSKTAEGYVRIEIYL
jgi:Holliday junction resolvase RusA-like endonuclease